MLATAVRLELGRPSAPTRGALKSTQITLAETLWHSARHEGLTDTVHPRGCLPQCVGRALVGQFTTEADRTAMTYGFGRISHLTYRLLSSADREDSCCFQVVVGAMCTRCTGSCCAWARNSPKSVAGHHGRDTSPARASAIDAAPLRSPCKNRTCLAKGKSTATAVRW